VSSMSSEHDFAKKAAEFVAKNLLPKIYYPQGSEVQRHIPTNFTDHCLSKGQRLPNPEVFLSGYSGIIIAEFCLEPSEDITIEAKRELFGTDIDIEGKVLKRKFNLSFVAFNVAWMGIRHKDDSSWSTECTGYSLKEEPGILTKVGTIIDPDIKELKDIGRSARPGFYCLEAGDFRSPRQRIEVNVGIDGIKVV